MPQLDVYLTFNHNWLNNLSIDPVSPEIDLSHFL